MGNNHKTLSANERLHRNYSDRNYIPWDESKEAAKNTSIHSWTFFYHKPYADDWQQAHQKAVERKWRYTE